MSTVPPKPLSRRRILDIPYFLVYAAMLDHEIAISLWWQMAYETAVKDGESMDYTVGG